jgi:hypothetical protein
MNKNALIGIAGVHYVVSELSRRGFIALPTIKNTAAYDIVALNSEGTRHANIQVKASSKCVPFFPMPDALKVRCGPQDFYVLVRWIEKEKKYQAFLLTGKQARSAVEDSVRRQLPNIKRGTRKKHFPTIHVGPPNQLKSSRWAKAWENWSL